MAAGRMTRDEEIRALAELLDLYRHWIRGAVTISRLEDTQVEEGFEAIVVETEALDLWMSALDKTADRLMVLTGHADLAARINAAEPLPAAQPPVPVGRPALRVVR